jgi:hypothetical protein
MSFDLCSLCVKNKDNIDMTEVKTFKVEQKFKGTEDLYNYLLKNVNFIGESIGIKIQKPLKDRPFCITGKEKRIASRGLQGGLCLPESRLMRANKQSTERKILFYASKQEFPESLGELIILAGAFDVDIIVFFLPETSVTHLEPLNWLQKICNKDTQFIVGEVDF